MKSKQHDRRWSGEAGSTMARVTKKMETLRSDQPDPVVVPPGTTPEEYRQMKLAESKMEREKIDRLLRENNERVRMERKLSVN